MGTGPECFRFLRRASSRLRERRRFEVPPSTVLHPNHVVTTSPSHHRLPFPPSNMIDIQDQPQPLHLPRILCLHGGGTNAQIFHCQTRALRAQLRPYFRFCFADAPFICDSHGPDVTAVYQDCGPFRGWLRWLDVHPPVERETAVTEIEAAVERAVVEDDEDGGFGDWVGILGFSQGAKVAGSLLLRQQMRWDRGEGDGSGLLARTRFEFAILMAGSAPFVWLEKEGDCPLGLDDAGQLSRRGVTAGEEGIVKENVLRLPTVHVHGLRDPGIGFHRQLLDLCCDQSTARLVEWDGEHRVPIKKNVVAAIVKQILEVADVTHALSTK